MTAFIISFYQISPFIVIIRPKINAVQFLKIIFKNGSPDLSKALIIPIWTIIPTNKVTMS